MIRSELQGVEFIACNTDAQALAKSAAQYKVQLGVTTTKGLGAGSRPDVGRAAAEENLAEVVELIRDYNMVFVTAGMGGGTGTGAAPVIARAAREMGILTVVVVTKPFGFEGSFRMKLAEGGIEEAQKHSDTLIVVPNQNLFRVVNESTSLSEAFNRVDNVLFAGVSCVTDLITKPGLINLDYSDVSSIMLNMGKAMMGIGDADGENRARRAAETAISNPLLEDVSMEGAQGVLINITGGNDITLCELDEAVSIVRDKVDENARIIFGATINPSMQGVRVSVVATGIGKQPLVVKPGAGENADLMAKLKPEEVNNAANVRLQAAQEIPAKAGAKPGDLKAPGAMNPTNLVGPQPKRAKAPGFFERLMGRGRSNNAAPVDNAGVFRSDYVNSPANLQPPNSNNYDKIPTPTNFNDPNQDESLEIPAFLRRKN